MNLENILIFLKNIFSFDENYPLLFTQFYFWAFFAIVFAFFSLLKNKTLLRNTYLFFVSLFFYYKTSGSFVVILLFITPEASKNFRTPVFSDFPIHRAIKNPNSVIVNKITTNEPEVL